MCRWLAYSGSPIYLEDVLFKTDNSLIDQSLDSADTTTRTNGDGLGIGWYGKREQPGLYRDIRPAWNDSNLKALAAQIESPMFLAHVRSTTGSPVQRTNCHPFNYRNWLFVHNGLINKYEKLRRDLTFAVAPDLFPHVLGSTDSELMFMLALTFGMESDVKTGIARMAGLVEQLAEQYEIEDALQMTLGISNGESLYAVRYSTVGNSRTLFHSASRDVTMEIAPEAGRISRDARAIVSEPFSDLESDWVVVPEASFLTLSKGEVTGEPFAPIRP